LTEKLIFSIVTQNIAYRTAFSGVDLILHAGDIWIPFWRGRSTPCAARMTSQAFFELAED